MTVDDKAPARYQKREMSNPLASEILKEVKAKMEREDITAYELSGIIGLPAKNQLYPYLSGDRAPKAEVILRLQAWLKGDAEALKKSLKRPTRSGIAKDFLKAAKK